MPFFSFYYGLKEKRGMMMVHGDQNIEIIVGINKGLNDEN